MTAFTSPAEATTIRDFYLWGTEILNTRHFATACIDVECLMQFLLRTNKVEVYTRFNDELPVSERHHFQTLLSRRVANEPVAYIVQEKEFYSRSFYVDNRVLIPRPVTEQLIDMTLTLHPANTSLPVLDIGTGSGCVAVTVGLERPLSTVTAWDISPAAIDVAKHNAERLNCRNVVFTQQDVFAPVNTKQKFSLILSNPPYVPAAQAPDLPPSVIKFEPHLALFDRNWGLPFYRRIAEIAAQLLDPAGSVVVEINSDIKESVQAIFAERGFISASDCPNLTDILALRRDNS